MTRRKRLLAGLGLLGMLGVLAFPSAGSALLEQFVVTLTANGPSPATLPVPVGWPAGFSFNNTDTVTHTVTFANGKCSIPVDPGTHGSCSYDFPIGTYDYTVDGTSQAQLVVEAIPRSVTLHARRTTIKRGSRLIIHGRLQAFLVPSPPNEGPPQPILILAVNDHGHRLHRIAVVQAKSSPSLNLRHLYLVWRLAVRPQATTTYVAEAAYRPNGRRIWEQAWSKPFRVTVRP